MLALTPFQSRWRVLDRGPDQKVIVNQAYTPARGRPEALSER